MLPLRWPWLPVASTLLLSLLLSSICVVRAALIVTPSTKWYGDDGSWSAVSVRVGSPQQWLDVLVNTQSSETWIVGTGGCGDQNPICISLRGGIYDSRKSSSWKPLGFYELGINAELGDSGYADYGLDSLAFGSTGVTTTDSLIGLVNATGSTWLGSFGLGIVQGSFDEKTPLSAISALVERDGVIQSHSYGYTAGAKYQQKGTPTSLTLGGYDANRFIPHEVSFTLNPRSQAQTYIDSISVVSAVDSNNWTVSSQILNSADRVSAIIDSSTPYLWLPQVVCERFAATLGLTYDGSLNLYTFGSNDPRLTALRSAQLSFTFSLSDLSSSIAKVNITLPYDAFDLQLTFPAIPNTTYGSDDASKYYFPLKQATDENQYRIGRSFLQEAYLITDYERNNFSIHQAIHTTDPLSDTKIVDILRADMTTLSGPQNSQPVKTLSTGAIVGIVIGSLSVFATFCALIMLTYRRTTRSTESPNHEKISPSKRRTMFNRLFNRGRGSFVLEASGSSNYATEIGADASHERFELAAPADPVELDSESCTADWTTENGSAQNSAGLSAYERFRRKLDPPQAATHDSKTAGHLNTEKIENDPSKVAHYRASEADALASPLISPLEGQSELSLSPPSPLTPYILPLHNGEPPTYRRINPANVLYMGRLPDDVQLPTIVPRVVCRDGKPIRSEKSESTVSDRSDPGVPVSLGGRSNGQQELASLDVCGSGGNQNSAVSPVSNGPGSAATSHTLGEEIVVTQTIDGTVSRGSLDPACNQQRLDGGDLVHVPQPAENRFSWEEERISGNKKT